MVRRRQHGKKQNHGPADRISELDVVRYSSRSGDWQTKGGSFKVGAGVGAGLARPAGGLGVNNAN